MMRKALKHEFSNSWFEITVISVAFIFLATITGFVIRSSVLNQKGFTFIPLLISAMVILYVVAIVVLLINVIKSFNSKIFGSEGYLTLTLPISIDKILLSKILVNFIWITAVGASLIIGVGIIVLLVSNIELNEILLVFNVIFDNFWGVAISVLGTIIQALFALVLLVFVLSILNIGKIKRFKFLLGLVIYYGLSTLFSWLNILVVILPYRLSIIDNAIHFDKAASNFVGSFFGMAGIGYLNINTLFWYLLGTIGLYFLSRFIIKNFVELE